MVDPSGDNNPFDITNYPAGSKPPIESGKMDPEKLVPGSPKQQELTQTFKKIIAAHLQEIEGKTTEDFLEDLSLELWVATRV